MSRYVGFVANLVASNKTLVRRILHLCSGDHSSLTGQNIHFLKNKYEKSNVKELIAAKGTIKNTCIYPLQRDELWKVGLIEEIAMSRADHIDIDFRTEELDEILEFICTK